MDEFDLQLQFGDENEEMMRRFMLARWGYAIVHTSKIQNEAGKGGRLDLPWPCNRSRIPIPDFLCIKRIRSPHLVNLPVQFFTDLKAKRKADYYRNRKRWESGIDKRCRDNYLLTETELGVPSWVFHLIYPTPEIAMDEQRVPSVHRTPPTGLFGCPVSQQANEYKGMVYWGIESDMTKLASLEEVLPFKRRGAA